MYLGFSSQSVSIEIDPFIRDHNVVRMLSSDRANCARFQYNVDRHPTDALSY